MYKIGIITITGGNNYGNRLQNYGLQTYLINKFNCNVYTLINNSNTFNGIIKKILLNIFNLNIIKRKSHNSFILDKKDFFEKFNKDYINFSNIKIGNFFKNSKILDFNCLICGSDQIWNSYFLENDKANFGYFYKKQLVISYAASFGTNKLNYKKNKKYKKYLNNIKYISVREDSGKKIIEELTDRKDVEVLIDPTMLLNSDEWDKISNRPKQIEQLSGKKYILNYFLGNLSEERKKEINRIAKDNDCEIINLLDRNDPFHICGPSEFLYLEKNAFLICTDSFHSSVFAILYDRPFIIFDRDQNNIENMNSRIDTLINKFKLKNRRYNGKCITKENLEHDYTEAYKILEKERKKSESFLERALKIKDSD